MLTALFLALTFQASPSTDARFDAWVAACTPHRHDLEATAALIAETGWERVEADDHPELAGSLRALTDPQTDERITMSYSLWARAVEGRRVHIVLNSASTVIGRDEDTDGDGKLAEWERASTFDIIGCGLWDFDADKPIDPAAVTAWVGAAPIQTHDDPRIVGGTWSLAGRLEQPGELHVGFVPKGSPFATPVPGRGGFSGVSISLSSAPRE